ncbi:MAG: GNAT family N-acetyltransferase [Sandaracinobacter sp.]
MLTVEPDDLSRADTRALVRLHLADIAGDTAADYRFALGIDALQASHIRLFAARENGVTIGIGAVADLFDGTGELKSMRTHPDHLRRGVAALLLTCLVAEARAMGWCRLSLETGTSAPFAPAVALYRAHGFVDGPAFADYPADSPHNQYLHLDL